ncbi:MAG: recombinase RecT, partial [Candidatus Subteraquimicrobiales bacterium]|nr:recombinase RecT [Candidatus Subteraquimicrobiales bacterium]
MEDSVALEMKARAKMLGLDPANKEVLIKTGEDGDPLFIITRNGYRKTAAAQPDYVKHVVYPLYDNSVVRVVGDSVEVTISGGMANLIGAIGFLYKQNVPGFFVYQVHIDDYESMTGFYWEQRKNTMIMKVCEVNLIRMAYPDILGNTYSDDEVGEKLYDKKKPLIAFIR